MRRGKKGQPSVFGERLVYTPGYNVASVRVAMCATKKASGGSMIMLRCVVGMVVEEGR